MSPKLSPLTALLAEKKYLVIDGAFGTELEKRGCDLNDKLWSAKMLLENPALISQIHLEYYQAGADIVITSSYQASVQGFARRGHDEETSLNLITESVKLAEIARSNYLKQIGESKRLLVAGSVGPYATLLADGSEYRGDYQLSHEEYANFHRPRIAALVKGHVDVLAFETIPTISEIQSLLILLSEFPDQTAYFSFSLRDTEHLCDGTPLSNVAKLINDNPQVVAIGFNCIALEKVSGALRTLKSMSDKPLFVYPNSGEEYDAITKTWTTRSNRPNIMDFIDEWISIGVKMIGGCCRTGPEDIKKIAAKLQPLRNAN